MGPKDYFCAEKRTARVIDGIVLEVYFWGQIVRWSGDERDLDVLAEFRRQLFLNSWSEHRDVGVGLF